MDWFRFYNETIDDPKMRKLDDKSFRIFVFLLCLASESKERGKIFEPDEDIIWRLRIKEKDYRKAISILESLDIISYENNVLIINKWEKRQFESDGSTERVKRFRERKRNVAETPPDTDTEQIQNTPVCPHAEIIEKYHRILPDLPRVQIWTKKRKSCLASRWKEDADRQNLAWWEDYFGIVSKSPFLLGKAEGRNGDKPFKADLEWLILPNNLPKVLEGRYLENKPQGSW
jgi:hypothetical protein